MNRRFTCFTTSLLTVGLLFGSSVTALADGMWECSTFRTTEGNICLSFDELDVILPASWTGKCRMLTSDTSVSFYNIKSRDLWTEELGEPSGGWLFSIGCSDDFDYLDAPSYDTIGTGDYGNYYILYPTDVQSYYEDEDAMNEYSDMAQQMPWILNHLLLNGETPLFDEEDYIFPQSSSEYMTKADLEDCDEEDLQMAINEIYARHHRKFALKEVQEYFDSCSWYTGTIEPADFDISVMNSYEACNVQLMLECMNAK